MLGVPNPHVHHVDIPLAPELRLPARLHMPNGSAILTEKNRVSIVTDPGDGSQDLVDGRNLEHHLPSRSILSSEPHSPLAFILHRMVASRHELLAPLRPLRGFESQVTQPLGWHDED